MERKTRFELATLALARRCSTPEPLPHVSGAGGGNSPDTLCLASLSPLRCDCRHLAARKSTGLSHDARTLSGSIPCFLELVEGIPQTLCVWHLCHRSAVTADISLLESPPDFLTTLEPFRVRFPVFWSWWRESNPQPADYKSAALPLSHTSKIKSGAPSRTRT